MQNIPAGLIPYNHEKYLTGKYIAETRGGFRPDEVVYLKGSSYPIIYSDIHSNPTCCAEDGCWIAQKTESCYDLFLRPKTVKKWIPVFKNWFYDSEEGCKSRCDSYSDFLKAVEVEVYEE